jgi:DNA polymerase (family 10)
MTNRTIAIQLLEHAHDLEQRRSSLYRIRAYRRAAETILGLDRPLAEIASKSGRKSLRLLPGIGRSLSAALEKLLTTGEFRMLNDRAPAAQPALQFPVTLPDAAAHGL